MKVIQENNDALQKIHSAINKAGNIVSRTLGPAGRNTMIGSKFVPPTLTNDGKRSLESLEFEDETENDVLNLMKVESFKTNEILGDSSTTTITHMQSVFNAGYEKLKTNDFVSTVQPDPNKVAKEILIAKDLILKELKPKAIKKLEDLKKVAFISTEDEEIADKVAEVVYKMGKDGVVKVESVQTIGIETEYVDGLEISSGFLSPYMANNDKGEAVITNADILVCNSKIENDLGLINISKALMSKGKRTLIVFVPDIDPATVRKAISARYPNDPANFFHFVIVKVSVWDKGMFEDIASVTGATLIDAEKQMTIDAVTPDYLGKVDKVIIDSKKSILIGGKKDIDTSTLKAQLDKTESKFDKQKIEERIARLNGKIAVIRAGAQTEGKTGYLKDKLDDGVNACKRALEGGVVKGGGLALYEIANSIPQNILTEAIKVPYQKIQASTGGIEITEDVIDPVISVKMALDVACEFATNMLCVGTTVSVKNETDTK